MVTHRGGCHCGRVRFEVAAPAKIRVDECNCSICGRLGYLHLIVPRSRFELIRGGDFLTTYRFHTQIARHTFCSVCGVKSFYVPRSHPEGVSVNARCIDPGTVAEIVVRPFDGANWAAHVSELEPLPEREAGGATSRSVQFWFEFGSTYSYPAALRIEALARARGAEVAWTPFLLGPIFREIGWNDSPFNLYPAKGHYMWRDLERICAKHAIPFRRPSRFPRNGLLAARVACSGAAAPWLPEFVRSVFRANFAEDLDISDPAVIAGRLDALGESGGDWLGRAQSPESKQALRRQTQRAAEIGIFGAPAFVVGTELFWGHDRLEEALAWSGF
jgi:2-hydroxychromene-2-carboxylate isomerase